MSDKYPAVIGISREDRVGAVSAYRIVYPMRQMEEDGYKAVAISASTLGQMMADGLNPLSRFDVVVFHGFIGGPEEQDGLRQAALALREVGTSVVVDYDDDYTNEHRKVHDYELIGLDAFSAITVSTPHLKRVMQKYNRNVRVIPNLLVPEMFRGYKRMIDGLTIGLTGSFTHAHDWEAVEEPVLNVLKDFPHIKLFVTGYLPDWAKGHPQLVTLKDLFPKLAEEMKDEDNFYIPLKDYGGILRQIDILLAPVDSADKFNWSKSNLKVIEGQMSPRMLSGGLTGGCACIATGDLPNYRDAIDNNKTGILVDHNDKKGWEDALRGYITDVKFREFVQAAGHSSSMRLWNIHTRNRERVVTYLDIMDSDKVARKKFRSP